MSLTVDSTKVPLPTASKIADTGGVPTQGVQTLDKTDRMKISWSSEKNSLKGRTHEPVSGAVEKPSSPESVAARHFHKQLQKAPNALARLNSFFSEAELVLLQTTSKESCGDKMATCIIKTYHIAPLIEKYLHRSCDKLSEKGKDKALRGLMAFAKSIAKQEKIEPPTYRSLGAFFRRVEDINLIRMARAMHANNPLKDFDLWNMEIPVNVDVIPFRAANIRQWFREHKELLGYFDYLVPQGLTLLPPEVGQLKNLWQLYLKDNFLLTLPREVGQLSELRTLDVRNNRLYIVPKEVGLITGLSVLQLSQNNLSKLPKWIGELTALRELSLEGNRGLTVF